MTFKKSHILFLTIVFILFTGCIKKLDTNGLTFTISQEELNKKSSKFPIEKNLVFTNVIIQKPFVSVNKEKEKLSAKFDINISSLLMKNTNGVVTIIGSPLLKKDEGKIYLKDIEIENIKFENTNVSKGFYTTFIKHVNPTVNEIFKNMPIYTVDKSSFKGRFLKDVNIKDGELLVTFGF